MNRTHVIVSTLLVVSSGLVGCGGGEDAVVPAQVARPVASVAPPPSDTTPDAPFRAYPPNPEGALAVNAPDVVERKLSNGIRVLFVSRQTLPLFAIRVGVLSGAVDDATVPPVVATATGQLLEMGTKKFTAEAYSEAFDAIGGRHSASLGWTGGALAAEGPVEALDRILDLVGSATLEPTFPEEEVKRLKERWRGQNEIKKTSASWLAWNSLGRVVAGEKHPLAHPSAGRPEELDKLSRGAIDAFYKRTFVAENVGIAVCGALNPEELLPKLEARFGKLKKGTAPRKVLPLEAPQKKVVFVEKKGATQSQVMAAMGGTTLLTDENREATYVADAIFGGMFSSRLNLNLREQHAFTYGAHSSFFEHRAFSILTAGGAIVREHTKEALDEMQKELTRFAGGDITDAELKDAKEYLRLAHVRGFETVWDTVSELGSILQEGKPANEFRLRADKLEKVTLADVQRAAKARYLAAPPTIIVVGDRSVFTDQLDKLKGFGPIEERGAYGEFPKAVEKAEKKPPTEGAPKK